MKIRHILAVAALLSSCICSAQQLNPITKAVLQGYEDILKENPKDFTTLYQRAAQYFNLSMYDNALADISKAIDCTPQKEKSMLASEFSLLADIDIELKEYDKALAAVEKALEINPDSYADLYRKGNIQLHLKDSNGAYRTFQSMQRLKSRSQEAFFGMAKACLLAGKTAEAKELIEQAIAADPTGSITYCRIGDLYNEMGDYGQAAANYLSAFALDSSSDRPLQSLIALGNKDFSAVEQAANYAIERSDNKIPLYFIKANIASLSGNYEPAYDAFTKLLQIPAGQAPSVYASLADVCLALDKLDEARKNIDIALEKQDNADNQILKSQIELASGNAQPALLAAEKALAADPANANAAIAVALAQIDLNAPDKAMEALNNAILSDASNPLPLMIRAYVNANLAGNAKAAVADYNRVALTASSEFPQAAYKALAKALTGKKMDGDAIIEEALKSDSGKDALYMAAVYFAQSGDLQKAAEMRDKAVALGFSNKHKLNSDKTANLNLKPLSHL